MASEDRFTYSFMLLVKLLLLVRGFACVKFSLQQSAQLATTHTDAVLHGVVGTTAHNSHNADGVFASGAKAASDNAAEATVGNGEMVVSSALGLSDSQRDGARALASEAQKVDPEYLKKVRNRILNWTKCKGSPLSRMSGVQYMVWTQSRKGKNNYKKAFMHSNRAGVRHVFRDLFVRHNMVVCMDWYRKNPFIYYDRGKEFEHGRFPCEPFYFSLDKTDGTNSYGKLRTRDGTCLKLSGSKYKSADWFTGDKCFLHLSYTMKKNECVQFKVEQAKLHTEKGWNQAVKFELHDTEKKHGCDGLEDQSYFLNVHGSTHRNTEDTEVGLYHGGTSRFFSPDDHKFDVFGMTAEDIENEQGLTVRDIEEPCGKNGYLMQCPRAVPEAFMVWTQARSGERRNALLGELLNQIHKHNYVLCTSGRQPSPYISFPRNSKRSRRFACEPLYFVPTLQDPLKGTLETLTGTCLKLSTNKPERSPKHIFGKQNDCFVNLRHKHNPSCCLLFKVDTDRKKLAKKWNQAVRIKLETDISGHGCGGKSSMYYLNVKGGNYVGRNIENTRLGLYRIDGDHDPNKFDLYGVDSTGIEKLFKEADEGTLVQDLEEV